MRDPRVSLLGNHCKLHTTPFGLLSAVRGTDARSTCLCRLVQGASVHRYLSDLRKSGTEQPCDLPQHARHVTETAAQLLQVRLVVAITSHNLKTCPNRHLRRMSVTAVVVCRRCTNFIRVVTWRSWTSAAVTSCCAAPCINPGTN